VLRRDLPDGVFHVTTRAVHGALAFRNDDDRRAFLALFAITIAVHDWICDAFCLLGTHYHLLVEARRAELSDGMQRLNGRYAETFNARHDRSGHLFGARFASWVIRDEAHYHATCRYIAYNPVRAGLCEQPEDWPWTRIRPRY
jgi:REP element-mobilizing transposase RayT